MSDVTAILTKAERAVLTAHFDEQQMGEILAGIREAAPDLGTWLDAIGETFYGNLYGKSAGALDPPDRERCLIALIAPRKEPLNLAVHVYMALAYGVTPAEVLQILGLAGVYSGIGSFVQGLAAAGKTFGVLKAVVQGGDASPPQVYPALKNAF